MTDFYLGKKDDKPFTISTTTFLTHTAVMGASGSGKTVICKSIVEEAILAGIPVIAIDPRGDIGGLGATTSTDNRVIFINNLVRFFWEQQGKKEVSLSDIIEKIEKPPFDKIGSLDVEKFISKAKRSQLSQSINALMVRAVGGIDLNFDFLLNLAKKEKKTPIIVFDLRKITDDDEKNTFVAQVLGEVQRWAWNKGGTSRLRALLYFDELYGFMPAGSLSPPSKEALLLLLKQARTAGLGIVVASQNPGDLDYRGLSNIATWVLGRLATNQDIAKFQRARKRVCEGGGGCDEDFNNLWL